MGERVGQIAKVPEVKQSNSNSRVRRTKRLQSMDTPVDRILFLQRTAGNQAVSRLIKSGALQAKLRIGQLGDKYEPEADRVADAVMRMPEPGMQQQVEPEDEEEETLQSKPLTNQITPLVQVQRQEETEEEEETLQAKLLAKGITPFVQKQVEPEEEEELIQEKATNKCLQYQAPEEEGPLQANFASGLTDTLQAKTEASQNKTGMSRNLKSGLEKLSGVNLSNIRVHFNSSKPSQLNALAYTQGQNIHVGPSQEKHLPHEGWHAVQQMQKRVNPTRQTKGISINDDAGLEKEADVMGAKVLHMMRSEQATIGSVTQRSPSLQLQSQIISLKSKDLCKTKFDSSTYIIAKVEKGDSSMTNVVDRLIADKTIKVNGRRAVYVKKMQRYNYKTSAKMHVGDCLLMLKQWNDPNIGILPSQKSIKSDLMAKIIATIYAEQTQNLPQQHRYIWHAIRKRIESWEKPAKLVYPGRRKGVLSEFDAFGNTQYKYAKNYLISGKKTKLSTSKFNPVVVDNIEKMVKSEWEWTNIQIKIPYLPIPLDIPSPHPLDAGMFYFHWTKKEKSFLNKCWKKKAYAKKNDKDRESACVEDFRQDLEWNVKLVKTIPSSSAPKKGSPPIGTMYIFKSEKQP